jgi:hypothetical protein
MFSVIDHISYAEYLGFPPYWLRLISDPYLVVSNMSLRSILVTLGA